MKMYCPNDKDYDGTCGKRFCPFCGEYKGSVKLENIHSALRDLLTDFSNAVTGPYHLVGTDEQKAPHVERLKRAADEHRKAIFRFVAATASQAAQEAAASAGKLYDLSRVEREEPLVEAMRAVLEAHSELAKVPGEGLFTTHEDVARECECGLCTEYRLTFAASP